MDRTQPSAGRKQPLFSESALTELLKRYPFKSASRKFHEG
jgi:hypothetical protein